jgi:hypothetical protein
VTGRRQPHAATTRETRTQRGRREVDERQEGLDVGGTTPSRCSASGATSHRRPCKLRRWCANIICAKAERGEGKGAFAMGSRRGEGFIRLPWPPPRPTPDLSLGRASRCHLLGFFHAPARRPPPLLTQQPAMPAPAKTVRKGHRALPPPLAL